MFSLLSWLSRPPMAIDLGSDMCRLWTGTMHGWHEVPSAVAIRTTRNGQEHLVALGDTARAMIGRTPEDTTVVRPFDGGEIVSFDAADHLFRALRRRAGHAGRPLRLWVTVPEGMSEQARRAVRDAVEVFDARHVALLPRGLAAALGAGADPTAAQASLVVDLGAASTDITIVSRTDVVLSASLDLGGRVMDAALARYVKREHALSLGPSSSEALRRTLGATREQDGALFATARGRCLRTGMPREVQLRADEAHTALSDAVDAIARGIKRVLADAPAAIASDVADQGLLLAGGVSLTPGLPRALADRTGIATLRTEAPERAVIRGAASWARSNRPSPLAEAGPEPRRANTEPLGA